MMIPLTILSLYGSINKKDIRIFPYLVIVIPAQIIGYGTGFFLAFIRRFIFNQEELVGFKIDRFDDLCEALQKRIDYFHDKGCKISDHGLEYIPFNMAPFSEIDNIYCKKRAKGVLESHEIEKFQTALLLFLAKAYHKCGWVQQFHLGAMRNNNSRMFKLLGADTGWDSIGQYPIAKSLSKFLDTLDQNNQLSKTILYNLNPADNEMMAT